MTPLVEHPAVRQEFADAIRYYAQIDPDLALGHAKRRPFYFRRRIGEARKMF